jgi:hypothetical protein
VTNLLIVGGILIVFSAILLIMIPRRRNRPSAQNDWTNEAFAARERAGLWVENETWVGHDDADPSSAFPGHS